MNEPTPEQDYEEALSRLVDIAAELKRAPSFEPSDKLQKLCADGRNMLGPLLCLDADELPVEQVVELGNRIREKNYVLRLRGTGSVAPTGAVMYLVGTVALLCHPDRRAESGSRTERIEQLCDDARRCFDAIDGKQTLPKSKVPKVCSDR